MRKWVQKLHYGRSTNSPNIVLPGLGIPLPDQVEKPGLCENCQAASAAFDAAEKPNHQYYSKPIHKSSMPLEVMARIGCPLCQLFLAKVTAHNQKIANHDSPRLGKPDTPWYFRARLKSDAESLAIGYRPYFASLAFSVHFAMQKCWQANTQS